jgi:glycosyltransferase involved in cell wall biosynthesis
MSTLDILIPVYNEGPSIVKVLDGLASSIKTPYRVLICYDDEEDTTLSVLRNYRSPAASINPVKNEGKGVHGAVMTGFHKSQSPAVIVFPADDTFNGPIIDGMVQKFQEGADIVAASRFMRGGCMNRCPWLKALLVRSAAWTLYHLARLPTHDPTNGFRLFSRRVLREIPVESSMGWAFSIELLVKCHRRGWQVAEVPAQWHERSEGKSRFRIGKWLPVYLRWYFYAFETAAVKIYPVWLLTIFVLYFIWVILPKLPA